MRRLLVISALALVAAACSASQASTTTVSTASTTTTTQATTTTTAPTTTSSTTTTAYAGPVNPLNGLPVDEPVERRTLAIKIDNHPAARPESGIEDADAVIELPVEGITRFMALFGASDSSYVGPVRSGRPTDPTLVKPLGGTFAISGAQKWVLDIIRNDDVPMIIDSRPGMFRISSRSAPHNLYGDTVALRGVADDRGYPDDPSPDLFQWGPLQPDGTSDALTLYWSPRTVWTWNGQDYTRTSDGVPHKWVTKDGETGQISADTLVVIFAERYTANPPDGKGTPVPAMKTVGSGKVVVFHGGEYEEGTWSRDSIDEMFQLTRKDGSALTVPPGFLWISLYPDSLDVNW
jgi:hypothetical protein